MPLQHRDKFVLNIIFRKGFRFADCDQLQATLVAIRFAVEQCAGSLKLLTGLGSLIQGARAKDSTGCEEDIEICKKCGIEFADELT